ncbi:DUF7289 family protein [Halomicrococcus gelatinilyticus]|uniref:DUF7289 family protein n=1 Tax=Halomicrococcus gelatinilyticus TaxID=1702103 RepID=UPI002E0F30F6
MSGRLRGQSDVVGVAILLGVTVVALGSLTASIGAVVDSNAATADANRVAADLDRALEPVETTGVNRGRISFSRGELRTVERDLRVLDANGVVRRVRVDALVFTTENRRVAFLAGAVVRGAGKGGRMVTRPPVTASPDVLVVGAPELDASDFAIASTTGKSVVLGTDVTHNRTTLGDGRYRVAVETATPGAWRRYFERANATVTTRNFDDDGVDSVVATYPGERMAYLVVHEMRLEVAHG